MNDFVKDLLVKQDFPIEAHPGEPIENHIELCSKYFERISKEKNLKIVLARYGEKVNKAENPDFLKWIWQMFRDVIDFHDVGKATPEFQRRKMHNMAAPEKFMVDNSARHSMISAIVYLDYYFGLIKKLDFSNDKCKILRRIAKINSYVISRHHGRLKSLADFLDDIKTGYGKMVVKCLQENGFIGYEIRNIDKKYLGLKSAEYSSFDYFYCRLVYSVLVSCDYYATTEYKNSIEMTCFGNINNTEKLIRDYEGTDLQKLIRSFEKKGYVGSSADKADNINILRSMMFLDTEKAYSSKPDEYIYFLQAPTGSGKSNMALNISMQMMKRHGRKLFYIYPFNTLIEQNLNTMRKLFSDEVYDDIAVVNSLTPIKINEGDKESEGYYQKALLDRQFLHYPMVLSTHVSFFDLLFGANRESSFGFYQLIDAVVVLDEIQSYRNKLWGEFMILIQACAELMGMHIIIMSATLPDLTLLSGNSEGVSFLLKDTEKYFKSPFFRERVKLYTDLLEDKDFSLKNLKEHILSNHSNGKKVLIEFLYKKTANEFFQMMKEEKDIATPVLCITGDDSLYEREKILQPIVSGEMKECILISTQVLEAGADIDMDVGYKNISKLDSEEQFLGRINRSCKKTGITYFFYIDKGERIYKDDYRICEELTLLNPEMKQVLVNKDFDFYYRAVLKIMKSYGLENTGADGLEFFERNELGVLDFPAISKKLRLIEENASMQDIFLCRNLKLEEGRVLEGKLVWNDYITLLRDEDMDFAEKKIKLSKIRVEMSHFIYQIRYNADLIPDEQVGDLFFIENGEDYFKNGKLDRKKLENKNILFI